MYPAIVNKRLVWIIDAYTTLDNYPYSELTSLSSATADSTEVAFNNPNEVHALVLLSSTLLDEANWAKKASVLKGKRFLQSHGTQDQVLPFAVAQKLYQILRGAGMEGEFVSFNGGHEIPMPVLQKCQGFLNSILS